MPEAIRKKSHQKWTAKINSFDEFVLVTPEYKHGIPEVSKKMQSILYLQNGMI
ncbi:NAD(P)H-dependent oxidoreductase [Candidatus Nitrosocosmicus franklandus]|uniref:NAD(P)H-dependent oxidoreductase n=1 Tax=Candidatus Nitrosocosmicus franklandianus TaxID=1798806 RepID=UPI0010698705